MTRTQGSGILVASICAGPAFLLTYSATAYVQAIPQALPVQLADIVTILILIAPIVIIGTVTALVPITVGSLFMHWLGSRLWAGQSYLAWAVAGGGAAFAACEAAKINGMLEFIFVATACISASISRRWAYWAAD